MPQKTEKFCCVTPASKKTGADNRAELVRVNRIKGQVEGIARMIEEKAYCPDIITQIQAARSALGSLQAAVLASHLEHCVKASVKKGSGKELDNLFQELLGIFKQS